MFSNKSFNKSIYNYLLPSLATALIFCTVLLIKGIYPFGIATIDFYDLSDQGTPIYLHIYDSIHGHKNLFYDLYSALTTNMTGMLGTSGISPFNLFFLFIQRESVLKCMSIFILIKMMIMSLGMYLFLDKASKVPYIYKLTFAVCYGFSGYVLLHYTSHIWFDNVAYFPFVMLGLFLLVKEGKCVLYTVTMALSIICGYYISVLFFIYIFLVLGLALVLSKISDRSSQNKITLVSQLSDNKNDFHIVKLLICSVISIAASSFILIPQFIQTVSSARFTNESGGGIFGMYMGILRNVTPAYTSRWFVILNVSLSAAIIICGIIKYRHDKQLAIFTVGSVIIICAELLFENINLFWHYGSYVHYPLRNGFMIGFTLSFLACKYLEKYYDNSDYNANMSQSAYNTKSKHVFFTVIIFTIVCIAAFTVLILLYSNNLGMSQRSVFHLLAAVMTVCAVVYIVLLCFKKGAYIKLAPVLVICELLFYGYIFLGQPAYITGYTEDPEMERDSYYICNQIYDAFNFGSDNSYMEMTKRVKNPDESLNSNYPLVLRRSALSNWTALISPKLQNSAKKLGYTVQYTRLLDSGGTVFSDALLGISNIITCVPQDDKLYELIDTADIVINRDTGEKDEYYYYKCKYELPWGIFINDIGSIDFEEDDAVKLYNGIYTGITGTGEKIAEKLDLKQPVAENDNQHISQKVQVSGNQALYYFASQVDTDDYNTTIKVNNEVITIPSIREKDNTLYPAHFNNNAVYLGSFTDEDIDVDISFNLKDKNGSDIDSVFEPELMAVNLDILGRLCEEYKDYSAVNNIDKTSYELSVNSYDNGYIMLPLSYDKGYIATVNGKEEDVIFLGGLFMAVPVVKGVNNIVISFSPAGLNIGIIISVLTVILAIAMYFIFRNREFKDPVIFVRAYEVIWCFAVVLMYVVPVAYSVVSLFVKI